METLVGFAVGFLVGTRLGQDGLARLRDSWVTIRESADVRHLVGEAATAVAPLVRELSRTSGSQR